MKLAKKPVDRFARLTLVVVLVAAASFGAAAVRVAMEVQPAYAAGNGAWQRSGQQWWYAHHEGGYAHSGWERINDAWYLFDNNGWMLTGWQNAGGTWYYLRDSGAMAKGWTNVNGTWYLMSGSGAMLTGWCYVGGKYYYMNGSGAMQSNQWIGDYYLNGDGSMATNCWIGNYYVGADGRWLPEPAPAPEPEPAPAPAPEPEPDYNDNYVESDTGMNNAQTYGDCLDCGHSGKASGNSYCPACGSNNYVLYWK